MLGVTKKDSLFFRKGSFFYICEKKNTMNNRWWNKLKKI